MKRTRNLVRDLIDDCNQIEEALLGYPTRITAKAAVGFGLILLMGMGLIVVAAQVVLTIPGK